MTHKFTKEIVRDIILKRGLEVGILEMITDLMNSAYESALRESYTIESALEFIKKENERLLELKIVYYEDGIRNRQFY